MDVREVDPPYIDKVEGTYFASSINYRWACCIRERVHPAFPVSSHIDYCLIVILTLRTWAVWNQHPRLSIILPILYSLFWGSGLIIIVHSSNSIICKWNFHARFWWMIHCIIDGAPPYPGFNGCFLMYASKHFVLIWVLLLVWDARKCKYSKY